MKKKMIALMLVFVFIMLSACSTESYNGTEKSAMSDAKAMAATEDMAADTAEMEETAMEAAEPESGDAGTGSSVQAMDSNRKLIQYLDYSVETKEFDKFVDELNQLVAKTAGYVEYSEVSGNDYGYNGNRSANYTLRIPVKELGGFKTAVQDMGNVVRQSERVEDVTLHYVDTESHIKALKAEQESLMEMLEKAEKLEEIIAIQNRLTEVRYQLESCESQIRTYDNAIEYSRVSLYLTEVERETQVSDSFGARLKERFSDSLYGLKNGLSETALFLLGEFLIGYFWQW